MKKKFLTLALSTALLALVVFPSGSFAATTGSSSDSINVNSGQLSISLSGTVYSNTFQLSSYRARTTDSEVPTTTAVGNRIKIVDYTGSNSAGHKVNIKFATTSWSRNVSDTSWIPKPSVYTSYSGSTGTSAIRFRITGTSGSRTLSYASRDTTACTGDTTTMSMQNVVVLGSGYTLLSKNTASCPGSSMYTPGKIQIVGPQKGLAPGTYTISGTIQLVDGTS